MHLGSLALFIVAASVLVAAAPGQSTAPAKAPRTSCNPLPIANYPVGLPETIDPMLFVDGDGRLFFYWGCTETAGIYGIELDARDPTRPLGQAQKLIPFSPDAHPWERVGEFNARLRQVVGWRTPTQECP